MTNAVLDQYNIKTVGVAWYSLETWQRLAATPEARIDKSYQDFVHTFDSLVRQHLAQGRRPEKVEIDLDHMIAWCHRNGYEINSTGRAIYGTVLMAARDDPAAWDNPIIDNIMRVIQ